MVPVFSRALVLTLAPCVLMFTACDRYRLVPASTTAGQKTLVRTWCRRSCCGWGIVTECIASKPRANPTGLWRLLGCETMAGKLFALAVSWGRPIPDTSGNYGPW